jgi:hypothetical protein
VEGIQGADGEVSWGVGEEEGALEGVTEPESREQQERATERRGGGGGGDPKTDAVALSLELVPSSFFSAARSCLFRSLCLPRVSSSLPLLLPFAAALVF